MRPLAVVRRELMTPAGLTRLAARLAHDAASLGRLIRDREVALVHSNTTVTLGGAPAARLTGRPHVWHVREIYEDHPRLWPIQRRLLGTAAALPCVSQATLRALQAPPRALVIPDGLNEQTPPPTPPTPQLRAAARERLHLDTHHFAILLAGRISDWKGQDILVRALADPAVADVDVDAVALLAGDTWRAAPEPRERLLALGRELGVGERMRLLGFFRNMSDLYAAADVVVVPSVRPDPLPNSALEAAAAGCCVVASSIGGLPEIVRDGETGLLIPPGDAHALATALAALAADPARRAQLGRASAADVAHRFAPQRLHAAVQGLYDEVLTAPPAA